MPTTPPSSKSPSNPIARLDDPLEEDSLEESDERPTVIPEFDPSAFARDSETRQRVTSGEATIEEARRLHAQGSEEDALFLVTRLLEASPLHAEAAALEKDVRAALERECWDEIGSESSVLVCEFSLEELKLFQLDNVSAFLLSLLDGVTTVEGVLDLSGVPRLLALRHLRGLVHRGIVTVRVSV